MSVEIKTKGIWKYVRIRSTKLSCLMLGSGNNTVSWVLPDALCFPGILISLSNSSYTGMEGESLVSVVLVKSGETQQDTTVMISLTDDTAEGQTFVKI